MLLPPFLQGYALKDGPYVTLPLPVGIVFTPVEVYLYHKAADLATVHAAQGIWAKLFGGIYMLAWSFCFARFLSRVMHFVELMKNNWPQTWDSKWADRVDLLVNMVVRISLLSIMVSWSNYLSA